MRRGAQTRRRTGAPSAADQHRAWLELVDTDGPFLAIPALKRVWPQGMPRLAADQAALLKAARPSFEKAWEDWDLRRDDQAALDRYREARDTWVERVLRDVFGWGERYTSDLGDAALAAVAGGVHSPSHVVTIRPTGALVHAGNIGALVLVVDPVDSLRDPLDDGWATSPIDRMEELLRHAKLTETIGVVTDGRWWAIVSARTETMAASGIVDAQTWIEEPQTRDAFIEMLRLRRLLGGKPEDRLTALFGESVAAAEEITEALGVQVRRAVELLVQALSEAALDAVRRGEPDPLPKNRSVVYDAAVTVMMRVVFLLFAEERGLLPQTRLFAAGYGISDELDVLDQRTREEQGSEALDATHLTWHRLLATSHALARGASFEDLRLPSYGGSLFDPERFPFLTARSPRGTLSITVSDRVMLAVLESVQMAQLRGEPARRISFRDIDVEQIGYIYEGLLGYTSAEVTRETGVVVGLIGKSGEEPEIPLDVLEEFAERRGEDSGKFADDVLAWVKEHQPAAKAPSKAALAKATRTGTDAEDAERALRRVAPGDEELRDRLRPFIGIIRRDLRDRPVVVEPGGVLVVETPSRATAGAHYTPRKLAEEVVRYALEPLVYNPGPHQTADRDAWRLVSPEEILDLKVADIACGSGAFLVGAARFLAARLVEAWRRDDVARGSAHDLYVHAIREVVAHCLYGADINAMAVEMCKLSLWLVSLDPKLPFSFVDDKVLHGNSLIGLTDPEQLRALHITPKKAAADALFDIGAGSVMVRQLDVDEVLRRASRLRKALASEVNDDDPQRSAATKRRQWREYQELTRQLAEVADGVIAAGLRLGGKPGKALNEAYENLRIAVGMAYPADDGEPNRSMMDGILEAGLTPTVQTDYKRWKPLHWVLMVPDVMERGGFDAVIGNPPFLGGSKITGSMGPNVRNWFVNVVAFSTRGNADLVAYFLLRALSLLTNTGSLGLVATNTVAQGDTRDVGLDYMIASGFTITRSVQSRSWPAASANLEYAAVWGTVDQVSPDLLRVADDMETKRISSLLEPAGRTEGHPKPLNENAGVAFGGCKVDGLGFVVEYPEVSAWLTADVKNEQVLFPYLNGEDLNSRPDASASRWVIDFADYPQDVAATYQLPYARALEKVKPEREKKSLADRRRPWWQYKRPAPALRRAIKQFDEVLAIAQVSKTLMPVRVSARQVLDQKLCIFAMDSFAEQAVLSSSMHQMWAIKYGSTMRTDANYSPSDVFVTFPRPEQNDQLAAVGRTLDAERREIMLRHGLGLTKLYNLVNDPEVTDPSDPDIARLREIHVELDQTVMAAYGWDDLPLDHGFHTYRQMRRWTVSPAARVEILDRLLEENHRRATLQGEVLPAPDSEDDDADSIEGDDE